MTGPVQKSISVKATAERAFQVFTEGIDSWWPRTHHIGKAPMKKTIAEGRAGGRCYSEQTDGTECDWGTVLVWDPPHRFTMAWQVSPSWQHEPDLAKASEVEVRFTPEGDGLTRVDLEHRYFERHGAGADAMRSTIDGPGGWDALLGLSEGRRSDNVEEYRPHVWVAASSGGLRAHAGDVQIGPFYERNVCVVVGSVAGGVLARSIEHRTGRTAGRQNTCHHHGSGNGVLGVVGVSFRQEHRQPVGPEGSGECGDLGCADFFSVMTIRQAAKVKG